MSLRTNAVTFFAQPRVSVASSGMRRPIIHAAIATAPVDCACPSSFSGGRSSYPRGKIVPVSLIPFEMTFNIWNRNLIPSLSSYGCSAWYMSPGVVGGEGEWRKKEIKKERKKKKLTWSNITLIVRLQLGHTATSSPSRMSSRHISNWSPQGQGYVYNRSSGWKVRSSNSTSS